MVWTTSNIRQSVLKVASIPESNCEERRRWLMTPVKRATPFAAGGPQQQEKNTAKAGTCPVCRQTVMGNDTAAAAAAGSNPDDIGDDEDYADWF